METLFTIFVIFAVGSLALNFLGIIMGFIMSIIIFLGMLVVYAYDSITGGRS